MTDRAKSIDAFRLMFAAVTLPFGAMLGGVLADAATKQDAAVMQGRDLWGVAQFAFACLALFAFFVAVPVACEGVLQKRLPRPRLLLPCVAATLLWCGYVVPYTMRGIQPGVWFAIVAAWLTCCAALVWLCSDVKKGIER